jgi:hypothetical protein
MVSFDGSNRLIIVAPSGVGVSKLDIRKDVYSAWKNWALSGQNLAILPAMRVTGGDPIGSNVFTGDIYFLINNWKLTIDLTRFKVAGALYSDNFDTAYFTPDVVPQYPATVASLVNTVASIGSTFTPADMWSNPDAQAMQAAVQDFTTKLNILTSSGQIAPTALENALAVRAELTAELARLDAAITTRLSGAIVPMTVMDYLALS